MLGSYGPWARSHERAWTSRPAPPPARLLREISRELVCQGRYRGRKERADGTTTWGHGVAGAGRGGGAPAGARVWPAHLPGIVLGSGALYGGDGARPGGGEPPLPGGDHHAVGRLHGA